MSAVNTRETFIACSRSIPVNLKSSPLPLPKLVRLARISKEIEYEDSDDDDDDDDARERFSGGSYNAIRLDGNPYVYYFGSKFLRYS